MMKGYHLRGDMMTNLVITRGNPAVSHCAFTFDDGPMRIPVDPWLDALEQGGACGTFSNRRVVR